MRVATKHSDRIHADVALIEGAIQQLGQGYRDLLAARSELVREAYHAGGHNATQTLGFFSDVQIRDRVAAALYQAGLGDVLNVGSNRDHSVSSLSEIADRFTSEGA